MTKDNGARPQVEGSQNKSSTNRVSAPSQIDISRNVGLSASDDVNVVAPNATRRRFVRGAAAAVPFVLTLRSGALLAGTSLCPGQVTATGTIDGNEILSGTSTPRVDDECYVDLGTSCPTGSTDNVGPSLGLVTDNLGSFSCSGASPGDSVVIITASSATSLMGPLVG